MGNQLAKVVKLVEIIPTHVASLNEDYLRLEEMALNAKQEKVFKDWLSKKIDAMYVYIDPGIPRRSVREQTLGEVKPCAGSFP